MSFESASELALIGFSLISFSLIFVLIAFIAIRKKQFKIHRNFMGLAILSNSSFLIIYILRLISEGNLEFPGPDWFLYIIYLPILIVHIFTAIISIYFVLRQLYTGWKGQTVTNLNELRLQGEYKKKHLKHGYRALIVWGSSFVGGISVFIMLYLIF